jgi:hypothetical protein
MIDPAMESIPELFCLLVSSTQICLQLFIIKIGIE